MSGSENLKYQKIDDGMPDFLSSISIYLTHTLSSCRKNLSLYSWSLNSWHFFRSSIFRSMEVEKDIGGGVVGVGVGGGGGSVASSTSLGLSNQNQRQRFYIELRPGETTIVSWKKLVNGTNNDESSPPAPEPQIPGSSPNHESRDELDENFQVDKSRTKHSGFFVNREKLEHISESSKLSNYQPKKRRKDTTEALGGKDDVCLPTKCSKSGHVRMKAASRNAPCVAKDSIQSQGFNVGSEHFCDGINALVGFSMKKPSDSSTKLECSSFEKTSNGDHPGFPVEEKDINKIGVTTHYKDSGDNVKVESDIPNAVDQKYRVKNAAQLEPQSRRLLSDTNEQEHSTNVWHRDDDRRNELPDLNLPYPGQALKAVSMHLKDVSGGKLKGTMLERAILELEKMVAESQPRQMDVPDVDTSSLAIKRRLPRELKQKLVKIARLAQLSQGKISDELINRLMGILGHWVQRRTLKRNLRDMASMELSARKEKDDRFKQIKKEVVEMIKLQAPSLKTKASEHQDGWPSNDFEELPSEEKEVNKGVYCMDNKMEDKICDLYDLYVQGMDENKAPQIRKLYIQLAEFWPKGAMDKHGIRNAIWRAKERRRGLCIAKGGEKHRRKKFSTQRMKEIVPGEASSVAQSRSMPERLIADTNRVSFTSPNRKISHTPIADQHLAAPTKMSSPPSKSSNMDLPKQGKFEIMKEPPMKQLELGSKAKKLPLKRVREKDTNKSHKRGVANPHKVAPLLKP